MEYTRRKALLAAGGSLATVFATGQVAGDRRRSRSRDRNPTSSDGSVDGWPTDDFDRIDTPPYEIEAEDCGFGSDNERDPLYLCDEMPAAPSLEFEYEATSRSISIDGGLGSGDGGDGNPQLFTALLTDETDLERVDLETTTPATALLKRTDFAEQAVLIVQTGWGSSAETPYIKRIEETDDGIHAFGCYRRPCLTTTDYTYRTGVARFERPDELESGLTSLTVDPETRVNVATGEGIVTITDGW
ncbi:hypothetical protein EL22_19275 [Halostagnicola sp. A56]|uniref:hypothetical protein n=1 Tax=Halostagnicola sp. A56 TaxID=1495067 RepID=UPI0004A188CE|nr:hypothetical protein [Halostagnicola sp. A56]KDE59613.1 hypothetical protein EL22_19275 [Halostagnicola sp. A56]